MKRGHYLGTDRQGRDVASACLRISHLDLLRAVSNAARSSDRHDRRQPSGYLGGRFDIFSQRIIEVLISIPFLYVVIILAALIAPTFWMLLAIMAIFHWITITFYMRTEMYREKTREYCLAAKSYGASHLRIVFRHLLPNCLTPLVTFTPFAVVASIFALTSLRLPGYGLPGADAKLGRIDRPGAFAGKSRQAMADPGAVWGAYRDVDARGVHRRIGTRGL